MTAIQNLTTRKMDSAEKILYHKDWLNKWHKDPFSVFPIYIEITPAGFCNHRCIFCNFDFLGYKKITLPSRILKERVGEMASIGVKAIQYAGEGEPLLHPDMADIAIHTRNAGIEISMLTNGVFLTKKFVDKALSAFSWFQVSLDAATSATHAKIHQTSEKDFGKIIKNLENAVKVKNKNNFSCDIGVQMVFLPLNYHEAVPLTHLLKKVGIDYLTIKPYSHHSFRLGKKEDILGDFDYSRLFDLENELKEAAGHAMDVDFRKTYMAELQTGRSYDRCLSVPMTWAYISADGAVYSCSGFLGDERFLLGNINEQTFEQIWFGEKRKQQIEMMKDFNAKKYCREGCRMKMTNKALLQIKNNELSDNVCISYEPSRRVNFI